MNITPQHISKKVKELRLERHWTQAKLAHLLRLSQNRLSEIESGQGSFSAEQLITILANFNVPLDYFVNIKTTEEDRLQNVLARLGARHLQENPNVLATDRIKGTINAVTDTIAIAKSPRLVTALAPVIVNCSNPGIFSQIRYKLLDSGFIHKYGWILENVLEAIRREVSIKPDRLPKDIQKKYEKAEGAIRIILKVLESSKEKKTEIWEVDEEIASQKTFIEVQKESSEISKKWGIVTRIQPEDFVDALRHGFNY